MPSLAPPPVESLPVLSFGLAASSPDLATLPPFAHAIPSEPTAPADGQQPSISFDHLVQTVLKAKRVVVVCGAGISCASGIPDFRSSEGLFESLKRQHPTARLASGKDLFDASLFASEANASIFYTMIAELKTMADKADPTPFHRFLKWLDDEGKLFRVYTQNIDGLEEKAGLSYGLGGPTSTPSPPVSPRKSQGAASQRSRSHSPSTPPPPSISAPLTSTAAQVPRCIPLHGVLSHLFCPHCSHTVSITPHLPTLAGGSTLPCPKCTDLAKARAMSGERSRGIGWLKPKVVLYGETHPDGERVGDITRRDLMGARPDLLLVVGTSLKVPGTKLLVRELARVIRPPPPMASKRESADDEPELEMPSSSAASSSSTTFPSSSQPTSSQPSRRTAAARRPPKVHSIYLNFDFPTPAREFRDTFDVWARGDAQSFVAALNEKRRAQAQDDARKARDREEREMRRAEREAGIASSGVDSLPAGVKGKSKRPAIDPPRPQPKKSKAFNAPVIATVRSPGPAPKKVKPGWDYVEVAEEPAPALVLDDRASRRAKVSAQANISTRVAPPAPLPSVSTGVIGARFATDQVLTVNSAGLSTPVNGATLPFGNFFASSKPGVAGSDKF